MRPSDLHSDAHISLRHDKTRDVLVFVRSAEPYARREDILRSLEAFERAVADARARGLLIDSRLAPLRSDPEFEALSRERFHKAFARFERVAVLLSTATGRLQVGRIQREGELAIRVFDSEPAAYAYLAGA